MFAALKNAVIASGNSWPQFVDDNQVELMQVLAGTGTSTQIFADLDLADYPALTLNNVTTATDSDTVAASENRRVLDLSGRFYMRTDNRWTYFNASYGAAAYNHNQNGGTGVEPSLNWNAMGYHIKAGEKIRSFKSLIRRNSQVAAVKLRLIFLTGTPTGTAWNSKPETTFSTIHSDNNVSVPTSGWYNYSPSITEFTAPSDGFLNIAFKPIGTLSATRYIYINGQIEVFS